MTKKITPLEASQTFPLLGEMPLGKGGVKGVTFLEYNYNPLLNLFESDFINLDTQKDFIPFGDDNLLPQQIIQLSRSVTIHRAIINSKADYFSGTGIHADDTRLSEFILSVNNYHESLHSVITKVIFDDVNTGNAFMELVTDKNKSYLSFYHIDSSMCRLSVDNNFVIIHPAWRQYKGAKDALRTTLPLYPNFEKKSDGQYHSIYHIKQYEPEFSNYGLPSWYAGLHSVIIAGLTDRWNQDRLENQFNASGLLIVPGVNSAPDAKALDDMFATHAGVNSVNAHNLIVQYLNDLGPGQSRDNAQYLEFKKNEEGNWLNLHLQAYNNLLSIHGWFKTLCSFFGEKTGFDTQRIINEYEIALNTSIKSWQHRYSLLLNTFFADFNFKTDDIAFENQSPVYRLNPVKFVWELRRDSGLEYDKNDPRQKLFYSELKNTFTSAESETDNDTSAKSSSSNNPNNQ